MSGKGREEKIKYLAVQKIGSWKQEKYVATHKIKVRHVLVHFNVVKKLCKYKVVTNLLPLYAWDSRSSRYVVDYHSQLYDNNGIPLTIVM